MPAAMLAAPASAAAIGAEELAVWDERLSPLLNALERG